MLLTTGLMAIATATAAPQFEADVAADAVIATRAWEAAVACTGRDPGASKETGGVVELTRSVIPGGWLGRAHVDDDHRLERIDISAPAARIGEVIVHEVAHAWVSEGDHALVEGAAELLADCIVAHEPGLAPLQFDDGRDLVTMSDLRAWEIAAEGRPLAMDGARTDAYLGAARLLRTAATVIGHDVLWADGPVTWSTFEQALVAAGAPASSILDVVRSHPVQQRSALADADRDGLTDLHESLLGTDPHRFDSDGDGWWDGALDRPDGAIVIPLDGTPTCSGAPASAVALPGGNLRGLDVPGVRTEHLSSGIALLSLSAPNVGTSGGLWAILSDASPSDACATSVDRTVAAVDASLTPHVAPLAEALDASLAVMAARFGPSPSRTAVLLGGDVTSYDGHVVRLGRTEVEAAVAKNDLDGLARIAAALPQAWRSGDASWRDAQALANSLAHN